MRHQVYTNHPVELNVVPFELGVSEESVRCCLGSGVTSDWDYPLTGEMRHLTNSLLSREAPSVVWGMKTTWTFEGYWNTVLGDKRTPEMVVQEFGLGGSRRQLDEWLGDAEATAIDQGAWGDMLDHHEHALDLLETAVAELAEE